MICSCFRGVDLQVAMILPGVFFPGVLSILWCYTRYGDYTFPRGDLRDTHSVDMPQTRGDHAFSRTDGLNQSSSGSRIVQYYNGYS